MPDRATIVHKEEAVLEIIGEYHRPVLETIEDFHLQGEVSALFVKVQNLNTNKIKRYNLNIYKHYIR